MSLKLETEDKGTGGLFSDPSAVLDGGLNATDSGVDASDHGPKASYPPLDTTGDMSITTDPAHNPWTKGGCI